MILDIRVVLKCFSFYGTETRQMEQKHRSLKVNYIVVIRERERDSCQLKLLHHLENFNTTSF